MKDQDGVSAPRTDSSRVRTGLDVYLPYEGPRAQIKFDRDQRKRLVGAHGGGGAKPDGASRPCVAACSAGGAAGLQCTEVAATTAGGGDASDMYAVWNTLVETHTHVTVGEGTGEDETHGELIYSRCRRYPPRKAWTGIPLCVRRLVRRRT